MTLPAIDPGSALAPARRLVSGFAAVSAATGPMWIAGILLVIGDGCKSGWPSLPFESQAPAPLADALTSVAALVVAALLFLLGCFVQTGAIRLHVLVLQEAKGSLDPVFSGADRLRAMIGWKLVSSFAASGAALAVAWPGLVFAGYGALHDRPTVVTAGLGAAAIAGLPAFVWCALGGYFGDQLVALDAATPLSALRRSFALARGVRVGLLVFAVACLALELASVLGLALCCAGVLFTVPLARSITGFARTEAYLLWTRGARESERWQLWQRKQAPRSAVDE